MIEMININSFHENKNNFRLIKEKVLIEKIWAMRKMGFSGKYVEKTFSLKRLLVSECILKLIFLWELQRIKIRDMFHVSVFPEKSLNRLVLVCFIFICFLITMHEIDTATEVYLEPIQTYMNEIFCENS